MLPSRLLLKRLSGEKDPSTPILISMFPRKSSSPENFPILKSIVLNFPAKRNDCIPSEFMEISVFAIPRSVTNFP